MTIATEHRAAPAGRDTESPGGTWRAVRTELRRGSAPVMMLAVGGVGVALLFTHPEAWAGRWYELAGGVAGNGGCDGDDRRPGRGVAGRSGPARRRHRTDRVGSANAGQASDGRLGGARHGGGCGITGAAVFAWRYHVAGSGVAEQRLQGEHIEEFHRLIAMSDDEQIAWIGRYRDATRSCDTATLEALGRELAS